MTDPLTLLILGLVTYLVAETHEKSILKITMHVCSGLFLGLAGFSSIKLMLDLWS